MMARSHPFRSAILFSLGVLLFVIAVNAVFFIGKAHAEGPVPIVSVTPSADAVVAAPIATLPISVTILTVLGVVAAILVGLGLALHGLAAAVRAFATKTATTADDRLAAALDRMGDLMDSFAGLLGKIVPAAHAAPPPPPRDPQSGRATLATMLAVVALGAAVLGTACGTWRERTGASVGTAIDCETPNLKAAALELLGLAGPAIKAAITGDGHVDRTQFKAALATIKTDAPRCAVDAAIAALLTPAPAQPAAAMAAPFEVNAAELRAAYAETAAELGWPAIR
jgi:hypothetical protein